jgi:curved DNA-binding protein CbpA
MGTLYDLLGALPGDDAGELRTAFRKAAKATHPDINPDNPDAALTFRELVRAYDILTDADQRATYDQLLAIALQPPGSKAMRTYESVRKFASNTMAATVISAVLVGGYTLFGLFSKPPGAAEIIVDRTAGGLQEAAEATQADATAKEAGAGAIGRFDPVPGFATYNLGIQYYPRFAAAYFDRGIVLHPVSDFESSLANVAPAKAAKASKRTRSITPKPRKPEPDAAPPPEKRMPIEAALTP